ncbi:MAG: hypothetical protein L0H41_10470 [Microlunatus sp.]|nr:hypothetical protein [Microlunatus sp.]MDN5770600.1 hypothetical protein [Microlunatus sp.]
MTYPAQSRVHRSFVATLVSAALLVLLAGCGMKVQTLQPYTPAEGVNANVGRTGEAVQVRNLMILSRENGIGYLSASMLAQERDALTAVSGRPFKSNGYDGTPFTATLSDPVGLTPGVPVVLTDRQLITVSSPDLIVGGDAKLTLTFSDAGEFTIEVPVVDANNPAYKTITPSPTPS